MSRHWPALAVALLAVAAAPAMAAEPKAAAPAKVSDDKIDAEFLEFLGSLDLEDEEWREYLESRPAQSAAGKQSAAGRRSAARQQAARAAPPRKAEQVKAKSKEQVKP